MSGKPEDSAVLERLYAVIESRRGADPAESYSAKLLADGAEAIAVKLGEEAVETIVEALAGRRDRLVGESADLLYHLLVLWVEQGVKPAEVWAELARREGRSGLEEKASRSSP